MKFGTKVKVSGHGSPLVGHVVTVNEAGYEDEKTKKFVDTSTALVQLHAVGPAIVISAPLGNLSEFAPKAVEKPA